MVDLQRFKSLKYMGLKKERFPVLFLVLIETTHDVPFVGVQFGAPKSVLPIITENNSTTVAIAFVNLKTPHNQKSFLYRGLAPLDDTNIQHINDFVNSFLKKVVVNLTKSKGKILRALPIDRRS